MELGARLGKAPLPIRYAACMTGDKQGYTDEDGELLLVKALIDSGAFGLQRLLEVQNDGWTDEATNQHFSRQRQTADKAPTELNIIWFGKMKNILREIDLALHVIPIGAKDLKFLDLGCCPGGFSSYILENHVNATGVGVSLPPEDGGHNFYMEDHLTNRYELYLCNLTYLQLGPSTILDERLQAIPLNIPESHFDLVLLDGHQLRTQATALPWDHDRLLISQLILSLRSVAEGGTVVVKLPLPHQLVSARVLLMLKAISHRISVWKPRSMHANRGTFYAIARGINRMNLSESDDNDALRTKSFSFFLHNLQKLWVELTFGGEEGKGRYMKDAEDMDFVATIEEIIVHHLDWLIKLGIPLWKVQEVALRKLFSKNKGFCR